MPDDRRTRCQVCGRHAREVGAISWRGKCSECGHRIERAACDDQRAHQGPYFDLWRVRIAASVGAVLLDDLREQA